MRMANVLMRADLRRLVRAGRALIKIAGQLDELTKDYLPKARAKPQRRKRKPRTEVEQIAADVQRDGTEPRMTPRTKRGRSLANVPD